MANEDEVTEERLMELVQTAFDTAMSQGADALVSKFKQNAPQMLIAHREQRAAFEARLRLRWGPALDLYETTFVIAREAGAMFAQHHVAPARKEQNFVFFALTRLHARACHSASEVLSLLLSGHATAAMARWRTIHEIAVVMCLIQQHGQELARRYFDHEAIEAAKAAEDYQTHCSRLGYVPLSSKELAAIRRRRDELVRKYGEDFSEDYGWAADMVHRSMPTNRRKHTKPFRPTFRMLEKAAGVEHWRPFYRMASHGVHSNPKGILFQLEDIGPQTVLLAGPSNAGLADPGHSALISLNLCTVTLLNLFPDEETLVTLKALRHFVDEAGQAFLEIHNALVAEHTAFTSSNRTDAPQPNGGSNQIP
jgi:hypothetical protein